jgi:hypothetical protein
MQRLKSNESNLLQKHQDILWIGGAGALCKSAPAMGFWSGQIAIMGVAYY